VVMKLEKREAVTPRETCCFLRRTISGADKTNEDESRRPGKELSTNEGENRDIKDEGKMGGGI